MKTHDYMAALKSALHISSDYALAKALGVAQQTTSRWSQGKGTIDDNLAPRVAEILGLSAEQVLFDLHAERERSPELRAIWTKAARSFAHAACALVSVAAFNICTFPGTSDAATPAFNHNRAEYKFPNFHRYLSLLLGALFRRRGYA